MSSLPHFLLAACCEALAEREKLRFLLESAPDATVIVDGVGKITLVNARAEIIFGYSRSELMGQPVERLVPEQFPHLRPREWREMLERQRVCPMGSDLFARRKDGTQFSCDISLSPIETSSGVLVCSAFRDISDRKREEERIRRLSLQLEEALRRSEKLAAAGRLLATVAHEINNPLDSLGNLLYLMKLNHGNSPNAKPLVEAAQAEVERLMTITRQTLAPHREPEGPVMTRLADVLDDVIVLFGPKLKQARIKIHREYETAGEVLGMPGEFRQVFTNLISNAMDAMTSGGELRLKIERSAGAEVVVRINDSGCGIPAENMGRIFQPFFTTKGERGTGIGLWVIKGIIENMGGRVEVESSAAGNTGTCFSLLVPARRAAVSARIQGAARKAV